MGRAPLRLTPPLYHVLLTLAEGPSQGYALIGSLAERRGGRDQEGQPRERHRVRLEAGVPKTVDGCPRNGAASWRYEDLLLSHDDEGVAQVNLRLVGEQSVHHTLPRWVSRRVETPFEFQVPGNSADWETLHLALQEVDGPDDPAAELEERLCF